MATVYRATDIRLQRTVAVKIMHAHLAADQQFRDRFLHEALASAKLSHPNIVNVYDQGHESNLWYLVMEYVPNITLRDLLRERRSLSAREALSIFGPALAGLAAAHDAGILHRDLKPENILLADDGRIKLADFGLSRALTAHTAPDQSLIGSVAYMSPELLARGSADARSDIYAMGIILYEMLIGTRPFRGNDPVQIALQHANDPVPAPSATDARIPSSVDELVHWATAKRVDDRPRTAHVLREQAEDVLAELGDDSNEISPTLPFTTALPTGLLATSDARQENPTLRISSPPRPPVGLSPSRGAQKTGGTDVEALQRLTRFASRRGGLLVLIALLCAALAGGTGWYFSNGPGGMISIPDVVQASKDEGLSALASAGFSTNIETTHDLTIPEGSIISTNPTAGSMAYPGTTVTVTISSGPASVDVPAVIGSKVDLAKGALEQAGFVVSSKYTYLFSSNDADTVLAMTAKKKAVAEGDSLLQGTKITLTVSLGPIPSVVGSTEDDATTTLKAAGLTVKIGSREFSDTVASGTVISQKNSSQTMTTGDTVTLVVSKGQDLVAIPTGIVGQTVSAARATLEAAGFTVVLNDSWLPDALTSIATVSSIDPNEGEKVKRGSTITLSWSYTSG